MIDYLKSIYSRIFFSYPTIIGASKQYGIPIKKPVATYDFSKSYVKFSSKEKYEKPPTVNNELEGC
jgi:hypothetical protein